MYRTIDLSTQIYRNIALFGSIYRNIEVSASIYRNARFSTWIYRVTQLYVEILSFRYERKDSMHVSTIEIVPMWLFSSTDIVYIKTRFYCSSIFISAADICAVVLYRSLGSDHWAVGLYWYLFSRGSLLIYFLVSCCKPQRMYHVYVSDTWDPRWLYLVRCFRFASVGVIYSTPNYFIFFLLSSWFATLFFQNYRSLFLWTPF